MLLHLRLVLCRFCIFHLLILVFAMYITSNFQTNTICEGALICSQENNHIHSSSFSLPNKNNEPISWEWETLIVAKSRSNATNLSPVQFQTIGTMNHWPELVLTIIFHTNRLKWIKRVLCCVKYQITYLFNHQNQVFNLVLAATNLISPI